MSSSSESESDVGSPAPPRPASDDDSSDSPVSISRPKESSTASPVRQQFDSEESGSEKEEPVGVVADYESDTNIASVAESDEEPAVGESSPVQADVPRVDDEDESEKESDDADVLSENEKEKESEDEEIVQSKESEDEEIVQSKESEDEEIVQSKESEDEEIVQSKESEDEEIVQSKESEDEEMVQSKESEDEEIVQSKDDQNMAQKANSKRSESENDSTGSRSPKRRPAILDSDSSEADEGPAEESVKVVEKPVENVTQKDVFGSDTESDDSDVEVGKKPAATSGQTAKDLLGADSSSDSDSDKNVGGTKKKKSALFSDDEDEEVADKPEKSVADDNDPTARRSSDDEDAPVRRHADAVADEEEVVDEVVEEPAEPEETQIEVKQPLIKADIGKDIHLVRMPNFLSVETRPFDPVLYEDEIDEEDLMDEEGHTKLKLKVENTIRWRLAKDEHGNTKMDSRTNQPIRESNTRIVRWSDGSLSLHLGGEIFDVHTMDIRNDYNHLFFRQESGLQGQASFNTKLTFRPHSTDSFTHRKITMSLATKSNKTQKVKILPIAGQDPESNRDELVKKEEQRLRATLQRENMQRRQRERLVNREISDALLEAAEDEEENENSVSISAIKKGVAKKKISDLYSSSSDSLSSSDSGSPVRKKAKAKVLSDDDELSD